MTGLEDVGIEDGDDSAPHVLLEGETFVCHNCGQRYRMNLPCPVSLFAVAASEYSRIHRHCAAPE